MADLEHPSLRNKVIIMNGFSSDEIFAIMRTVKSLCTNGSGKLAGHDPVLHCETGDLIFAKTTQASLQTVLSDLIVDMSGDHEHLKANPPKH